MRRLIGYIIASVTLLFAIIVGATPVLTKLNTGREFTSQRNYREIVFRVAESGSNDDNGNRAQIIADEMIYRLNEYKVDDYSIKVQGNDTVAVAMNMEKKEFNYVAKYLAFSGDNFSLVSSNSDSSIKTGHKLFNPSDVKIKYQGALNVPSIVIPLTSDGIADVKALLSEFDSSSSGTTRAKMREVKAEGEETEEKQNAIYLWANLDESRGESLATIDKDPLAREKVLLAFGASADSLWNPDSDEKETELLYICASANPNNPNELDTSGLKDENDRANYLAGMLKAKKYDFEISCPSANITSEGIEYFENARVLTASAEQLNAISTNSIINFKSKTFIAVVIAIAIVSLLLIVFYRLTALGMITTTLATLFVTLLSIESMQVLFNTPAIIGLIILTSGILFGEIVYANRLKEEIYKGRSIKKSNQEASKKSNLLTIDASVIMAFSGLMMYALGDTALKSLGTVLFFGSIFALLMNLLVFKLLMYLLTNSTNLQSKYGVFNVEKDKVPNLMSVEEKTPYEGPYEKTDFTKRKTPVGIGFGILSLAAILAIVFFGVTSSSKSPLNVENAIKNTTVCYVNIDVTNSNNPLVKDEESFKEHILVNTKIDEMTNLDENLEIKKVSVYTYDETEPVTEESYFVTIQNIELIAGISEEDLELSIMENIQTNLGSFSEKNNVSVRTSKEMIYTPNQGYVALATGIAIVGAALYVAFRFKPSKAIGFMLTTVGSTTIAYGTMVALHFVGTTALTSVAMPLVAVTSMLAALFYLSTEKAMLKETHLELNDDVRKDIMVKALGKSASPMFVFMLSNIYIAINFFAFGVENSALLFASALIGEIVSVIVLLCVLGPISNFIGKGLRKIHLPKIKFFENKNKEKVVKKTSEPEETIFIGIND